MKKNFFEIIKNTKFQLAITFVVFIYAIILLYVEYKNPNYAEQIYPILKVQEQTKKLAANIDVGLFINNFPSFTMNKNKFTLDGIIWFKFPIGTESINTIKKFTFQNGEIIYLDTATSQFGSTYFSTNGSLINRFDRLSNLFGGFTNMAPVNALLYAATTYRC